jgi:hypothetical protein
MLHQSFSEKLVVKQQRSTHLSRSLTSCVVFCNIFLGASSTYSQNINTYSAVKLRLPETWVFYDTERLSDDGRAVGYIRLQNYGMPIDAPFVWQPDGTPTQLPVQYPYFFSYANAFALDGSPVGAVRNGNPGIAIPGYWTETGFVSFSYIGEGGGIFAAVGDFYVGTTGERDIDGIYLPQSTVWDANGNPTRVTGLPGTRRTESIGRVNASGLYVGSTRDRAISGSLGKGFIGSGSVAQVLQYNGFNVFTARDINDSGLILGAHASTNAFGSYRGYVADAFSNEIRDLGLLSGFSQLFVGSLNNAGEVVGTATNTGTGDRALYWSPGATQPTDLNTLVNLPGVTLVEAMDINNAGQILTRGTGGYYILTPIPDPTLAPPLAAVLVAMRRCRRQAAGGRLS